MTLSCAASVQPAFASVVKTAASASSAVTAERTSAGFQPLRRLNGEICQDAVGTGAFEGEQRFHHDPLVEPAALDGALQHRVLRSEEHTSELQSLMRISFPVFCLKKKT